MAAPILSDLSMVLIEFDPNKVTPQLECNLSAGGRATKGIENNAATHCWQIGFPPNGYRFPRDVQSPCILTIRLGAGFLLRPRVLADAPAERPSLLIGAPFQSSDA